jgi:hypothetical protein
VCHDVRWFLTASNVASMTRCKQGAVRPFRLRMRGPVTLSADQMGPRRQLHEAGLITTFAHVTLAREDVGARFESSVSAVAVGERTIINSARRTTWEQKRRNRSGTTSAKSACGNRFTLRPRKKDN